MSQIYRIEALGRDRFGSSGRPPRFVVIVEIPDQVISALENRGSYELQLKALGVAMNATWNLRVKYRELLIFSLVEFGSSGCRSCRLWNTQF
jgi:hypothetical protein